MRRVLVLGIAACSAIATIVEWSADVCSESTTPSTTRPLR
jgi:hypothetical protein